MPLEAVDTLCELVRIPSVNPMGRDVSGPEYYESKVTDHLEQLFQRLQWPHERHTVHSGRDNILARIEGSTSLEDGGRLLLLEAHMDTVPVEGMTIEPFSGELRDGRVWGRGACDIKGGMAYMLAAVSQLVQEKPKDMPTIILAGTVNEEFGHTGADHLVQLWSNGGSRLMPRPPDAVIVAEPTELNVVVAHKGLARWDCHTTGRASHSAMPHRGDNAIYKMARVLDALKTYSSDVVPTLAEHPLVGRPTLSVGIITGGISVNTVPDRCTISIDRRVLPGEDPRTAYEHVVQYIEQATGGEGVVNDEPLKLCGGLSDHNNGPLAERLQAAAGKLGHPCQIMGVPYGTDASAYSLTGVSSVVFGPGSIEQAHTVDEWLEVDQLHKATEILYQFCQAGL